MKTTPFTDIHIGLGAKMHEFAGYKCIGINHLGDWGTQFGQLITAYKRWGNKDEVEKRRN